MLLIRFNFESKSMYYLPSKHLVKIKHPELA